MRMPRRLGDGAHAQLVDHLDELRARLLVSIAALGVGSIAGWLVHDRILLLLEHPLPPEHRRLVTFDVTEPFTVSLKVSIFAGFLLALPVIIWQFWAFFAPATSPRIRRTILGFSGLAAALLVAGLFFGYEVALPAATHFLTGFDSGVYDVQIQASSYIVFAMTALLAVALVFEVPIVILGLVAAGVLSSRFLRKNRPKGYFAMACLAVALPGVDPVTTTLEALPLMALFEASIWGAVWLESRKRSRIESSSPLGSS